MPTAGGVYHWATIAAGPRWGRMLGFFTGWINFYGWMFDLASLIQITANVTVNLYVVYHQSTYVYNAWQVYIAYVLITWLCVVTVVFANRLVPYTQKLGMFFVIVGGLVTIIVVAAMPARHASSDFVWNSFKENNITGWSSGVAFLCGVLNGAFTIGTPDAITHMAEELPHPKKDLPKAIALQIGLGFVYAFAFAITIFYAVTDLDVLQEGINTYPLANIYAQATTSGNGTQNLGAQFGLLFIVWFSSMLCCIGTFVTVSHSVNIKLWKSEQAEDIQKADRCGFSFSTELPYLLGPCPRQCCASFRLLRQRLGATLVPRSRDTVRGCHRHRPRCYPSRKLSGILELDGLLHHPHNGVVCDSVPGQRPHQASTFPRGSLLSRKMGQCRQYYCRGAHHLLQRILLLP